MRVAKHVGRAERGGSFKDRDEKIFDKNGVELKLNDHVRILKYPKGDINECGMITGFYHDGRVFVSNGNQPYSGTLMGVLIDPKRLVNKSPKSKVLGDKILSPKKSYTYVYRLSQNKDAGFAVNHTDHGLFSTRNKAARKARKLEPNKQLRDYEFSIKREKVQ